MKKPSIPDNEPVRLNALHQLQVLDSPPEERFDRLTRLAKTFFEVPIALVSLVDSSRQWFKSKQGLDACETSRDISFCGHAILNNDIFYIPNALKDIRFADNPLVTGPPHIRMYAGAPLATTEGYFIGTLCIIDNKPRQLTAEQLHTLRELADCVQDELNQLRIQDAMQTILDQENRLGRYAHALEQLHRITAQTDVDLPQKTQELLELGRETFQLPIAILSHIVDETYIVEYIVGPEGVPPAGTTFELGETYCSHTLKADKPTGFYHSANSEIRNHPCYTKFKLECYIGAPLSVDGIRFGTVNFSGPEPREHPFSNHDFSLIQLFSQWIASEMSQYQAQIALQEATAWRQAILDSANFSIISTDVDGIIRTFNRGAERLLGYPKEEVVGKVSPAIIHDPDEVGRRAMQLSAELGRTIEPGFDVFVVKARQGVPDEREWTYIRKDGTHFPVLLSITAVSDSAGQITGFVGIGADLTERKKIDRMKSEFVSTVSHELRTPLTSIRGALGLLLGKFAGELSPKTLQLLEMADRNSERLTYLINDILDLEKIETGQFHFELKPLDLVALIQTSLIENEAYASKHNVQLLYENGEEITHAMVRADEHRLLQVFANLISNAVKYSPDNGIVKIKLQRTNSSIRTTVCDNGAGIPEEFRKRIFQRFSQADSSDTRQKYGTGLGLTISKAIIERHGGHISYRSIIGVGSEFYFDIPQWQETPDHTDHQLHASVLICEDNPDVALLISTMLEEQGLTSDIAASAYAAKQSLLNKEYQLLLLDLSLPDKNGLDLLKELRNDEKTHDLPVIVISARAQDGRQQFEGDSVTVEDWLQKPIDQELFVTALRQTLRGNTRPKVLHVEDDLDVIQIAKVMIDSMGEFDYATTIKEAIQRLNHRKYDLIILDLTLPDGNGAEILKYINNQCPVVIFSGQEPSREVSEKVTVALTKSKTSNDKLIKTIIHLLNQQ